MSCHHRNAMRKHIVLVFAAILGILAQPEKANAVTLGTGTAIRSCEDLPAGEVDLVGHLFLSASVNCDAPHILHVKEDVLIRSFASLETGNVHFFVHAGARLTLEAADGVHLKRSETSTTPLLLAEGRVHIKVGGWPGSDFDDEVLDWHDEHDVTRTKNQGSIDCPQVLMYNYNTLVAFDYMADPETPPLLPTTHDGLFNADDHDDVRIDDAHVAQPELVPTASQGDGGHAKSIEESAAEHVMQTAGEDVRTAKLGIGTELEPPEQQSPRVPVADAGAPGSDNTEKLEHAHIAEAGDAQAAGGGAACSSRVALPWVPLNFRTRLQGGGQALRRHESDPGTPRVFSADGTTAVWVGEDGALMFGERSIGPLFEDEEASASSFRTGVLMPSRRRQVEAVLRRRDAMIAKQGNQEAAGGGEKTRRRWFGFGRRDAKKTTTQKEHLGEIGLSVDDRGCVRTTVDGVCVLEKSGRHRFEFMNKFPWRRRASKDVGMTVTEEGIVVTRGDKTLWGYSLDLDTLE